MYFLEPEICIQIGHQPAELQLVEEDILCLSWHDFVKVKVCPILSAPFASQIPNFCVGES